MADESGDPATPQDTPVTTSAASVPAPASNHDIIHRGGAMLGVCVLLTGVFLYADFATKRWAEGRLATERQGHVPDVCKNPGEYQRIPSSSIDIIKGYFDFEYAENCGAAFGMGSVMPPMFRRIFFGAAALIASIALLWMFWKGQGGPWFAWAVPFVVSGALGNFLDRMRFGYVVDFIHVHLQEKWNYPTFNVADITITIGMIMMIIESFKNPGPVKPQK